ncbi:transposable element Tcb2 transposase [Trichonephila clavipes]|nr:transposable element Tcb2 transposase [Trichonephila clavipes]
MSFIRRPNSGHPRHTSRRENRHIVRNAASSAAIQAQVAPLLGAPVSSRTIRRRMAEGLLGSQRHLIVLPLTIPPSTPPFGVVPRTTRLDCSGMEPACGERLNLAFALQRHTAPTAGVMSWGAIAYNARLPLVLIRGTMTAQRYVPDILQPHVLPLMQRLLGAVFQQDNARPPHLIDPYICLQSSISGII